MYTSVTLLYVEELQFEILWTEVCLNWCTETICFEAPWDERDIVVTILVQCMCVHPSRFNLAKTSIFVHGFQNYLAQLFSLRKSRAMRNTYSGRLQVKVTLWGQNDKMVVTNSVRCMCITCSFVHGFQKNLAQLLSSRSKSAFWNICLSSRSKSAFWNMCSGRLKVKVTLKCQIIKWS